ncbi:unnamed protein product [Heligmosomoides polygyrus]|uniref:Uncharacterized protein n=1 Tax=Heligmosomoides polygyrus TaxID=6339 RepID=A0A3P8FPC9_HELPZ|nr:unnamed protein product [Heligmosomoides polygyrus]
MSDGKAHPVVDVQMMYNENDYSSQVASLDQSGSVSLWMVLRDCQGGVGVRPQAQLSLQFLALIRPDPVILRSSSQPTPLIANCMLARANPQLFLVGTDSGFLCSLSKTKTASKGPRLIDSKINVYGEVLCVQMSPFEGSVFVVSGPTAAVCVKRSVHIESCVRHNSRPLEITTKSCINIRNTCPLSLLHVYRVSAKRTLLYRNTNL